MLDPVFDFFRMSFRMIGSAIRRFIALLLWPFTAFSAWLRGRGWFVKIPVFAILIALLTGYIYLLFITQFWSSGDPSYALAYSAENRPAGA